MNKLLILYASCAFIICLNSCGKFLEVEIPGNQISNSVVFSDDVTADAALAGIYMDLYSSSSFASGSSTSITSITGLSSDELKNMPRTDRIYLDFEENNIDPDNTNALLLWSSMYKTIYEANAALSGLATSTKLTTQVRDRLKGEALFVRGFTYFYLVNLFGKVPLLMSTDYKVNSTFSRNLESEVYQQIITDLTDAEQLLPITYHKDLRIRPNKYSASALLARVYLFTDEWGRAEDKATIVIANGGTYELTPNTANVFLATNKEAIWQLRPPDDANYTNEGYTFNIAQAQKLNALNNTITDIIEPNDNRLTNWIIGFSSGSGPMLYLPYKYKRADFSGLTNEFYVVIRLAEVYLIRAEARIKQAKIQQAINDIDKVRGRAGIELLQIINPSISDTELFKVLQKEKQIEFLAEWGHRWFDLKRWEIATDVLGPLKAGWTIEDELYPIPQSEIIKNNMLKPQNPGY